MLKRAFGAAIAAALLLNSSASFAQSYAVTEYGVRFLPGASPPPNCVLGRACVYVETGTNALKYMKADGSIITLGSGGGGAAYDTITDEGVALTQRSKLNFTGAGVTCTDNAGASRTDCSIPGTINDLPTIYAAGSSQSNVTVGYNSTVLGYRFWDNATPIPGNLFEIASSGGTTKYFTSTTEGVALQSAAYTSGSHAPILRVSTTSHTGLAAGTPLQLFFVGGIGSTHQYTGGAWATYLAEAEIQTISTISATSATSISDYYTLKLTGAAAPGTNMTFGNRWVLGTTGGPVLFDRDFAGPTNVGVRVESRAAASLGSQQASPGLEQCGQGWGTGGGSSSQVCISQVLNPIQGSTPTSTLDFYANQGGGAYGSTLFTIGTAQSSSNQPFVVQPASIAAGTSTALKVTGATNTGLTASTEVPDVDLTLNRTVTWATGALTTQRFVVLRAPTIAFAAASTVTDAALFTLTGAPGAGANATLTNSWAMWTQAGASRFERDAIGTTLTVGIQQDNATAATAGPTDQYSSALYQKSNYWNGSVSTPANTYVRTRGEFISSVEYSELEVRNEFSSSAFVNSYFYGSKFGTAGVLLGKSSSGTTQAVKPLAVIAGGADLFEYDSSGSFRIISAAAASVGQGGGTEQLRVDTSNVTVSVPVIPTTDLTQTVGSSAKRFSQVWARRHAGVEQTIAAAATINLDPAAGEMIRVTLGATAVTTINASSGQPGERMTVCPIQDATGTRGFSGFSASFLLAGGAYTVTATADKRDCLTFAWDNASTKWVEVARAQNL